MRPEGEGLDDGLHGGHVGLLWGGLAVCVDRERYAVDCYRVRSH